MPKPKLFLSVLFLLFLTPLHAEYFSIEQYDIAIRIHPEGWFEVKETIDVAFTEPRHGIFRFIPFYYYMESKPYRIRIYDTEVEGWKSEKSWENGNIVLKIGDADVYVDGRQRYVIRYKVRHAFLYEEEHTEFYWNLTGNEWPVDIAKVSFYIEVPQGVQLAAEDYRVFTGTSGSTEKEATVAFRNGAITGTGNRPFYPYEGLTVAIRLPLNAVARPTAWQQNWHRYGALSLPAFFLLGFSWLFFRFGRDESIVKMAQYYPPDGFPPAEAGGFIDDRVDNRDLISLIPYWAGQGFIQIREIQEKVLFIFNSTDYEFIKIKDLPSGRPAYERTMFYGLFSNRDTVEVGDLKNTFYRTMASARKDLKDAIWKRNLYTSQSRTGHTGLLVAAVLMFPLAIIMLASYQLLAAGALILTGIFGFILRVNMLKKSKTGQELYQHLYGFRMFVDRADRERIERLLKEDPSYFEKTLPYAVAFGMAKEWSKNFEGLFTEPPSWYISTYSGGPYRGNSFGDFASKFESSMHEVQSVFTSSPSSSGSGGSSGGGFGGGGGGSW